MNQNNQNTPTPKSTQSNQSPQSNQSTQNTQSNQSTPIIQSNQSTPITQNTQNPQTSPVTFLPKHGHYRNLRVYQVTEMVYDITYYFTQHYLEVVL
ncbi:MAG: hypothetical protein IJL48_00880 [Bacteroidales bacterium]|nr:hypothetical protein [Bacteroidales bacterium]